MPDKKGIDTSTVGDETVFNKRVGRLDRNGVRKYSKDLAKRCDEDGRFGIDSDYVLRAAVRADPRLHVVTSTTDGDDADENNEDGSPRVRVAITCNCFRYVNRDSYWLGDGEQTPDLVLVERIEYAT